MQSPLQARQQAQQSWKKKILAGSASLTALCLISAYLYYSRTSAGLSCQQGTHAGSRLRFGIEEQNRLIEAIYQVCVSAYTMLYLEDDSCHAQGDSKLMDRYMQKTSPGLLQSQNIARRTGLWL